jgi:DNA processing protein
MSPPKISNIALIQRNDPSYPARLLDLYGPPNSLYIYGDIQPLSLSMLAIVGSRAASPKGIKNAHYFSRALSEAGYLVISGLARYISLSLGAVINHFNKTPN